MPGLQGPLFSLTASGTIGKTLTYSRWRGIKYARTRVVPANPRSSSQVSNRAIFTLLQDLYQLLGADSQESWTRQADGLPLTSRNAFTKDNLFNFEFATTSSGIALLGHKGAIPIPPDAAGVDSGAHVLTLTASAPPAITGYTAVGGYAVAVKRLTPSSTPPLVVKAGSDLAGAVSIALSMGVAGTIDWSLGYQYTRDSDGLAFWSPPSNGSTVLA